MSPHEPRRKRLPTRKVQASGLMIAVAAAGVFGAVSYGGAVPGLRGCSFVVESGLANDCVVDRSTTLAQEHGAEAAYRELRAEARRHPHGAAAAHCHTGLHAIGEIGGAADARAGKDPSQLLGGPWCMGGYTHGYIGSYTAAASTSSDITPFAKYCDGQKADSGIVSCVHGLGHGFAKMSVDDDDVTELCERLNPLMKHYPTNSIAEAVGAAYTATGQCETGVFMERPSYVMTSPELTDYTLIHE